MYICQNCNKTSEPNEKFNRKTVKTRVKNYFDDKGKQIATGHEIVKEIGVCTKCSNAQE